MPPSLLSQSCTFLLTKTKKKTSQSASNRRRNEIVCLVAVGYAGLPTRGLVKAQSKAEVDPCRRHRPSRRATASMTVSSSIAIPHLSLNKIMSSRPLTIFPSAFLLLLLWVLTLFNFPPGCDVSLSGECHRCTILTVD